MLSIWVWGVGGWGMVGGGGRPPERKGGGEEGPGATRALHAEGSGRGGDLEEQDKAGKRDKG